MSWDGSDSDDVQVDEVSSSTDEVDYSRLYSTTTRSLIPNSVRARQLLADIRETRRDFLNSRLSVDANESEILAQRRICNRCHGNIDRGRIDNPVPTITHSTRYSLAILLGIFLSSLLGLFIVYSSFPQLSPEEKVHIKIPWNINDAKNLGTVLDKYKETHYFKVYLGVSMTYIFLQTFAIPGSLFLSVLSGFLFNFFQGLILVCTCSALGASLCFLLSQLVGRKLIYKYFPEKAEEWGATVERHRKNLLNYVIFLRVTPFLPNWFINLTAPVIGVPLMPFAVGTFIGVAPPSFVALQAGQTLHKMSATDTAFSWTSFFLLIVFGFVSLIPIYFKDNLKKKFE